MPLQTALAARMPRVRIHIELLVPERIKGDFVAANGNQKVIIVHGINGRNWTRIRRHRAHQFARVHVIDERPRILAADHAPLAVLSNAYGAYLCGITTKKREGKCHLLFDSGSLLAATHPRLVSLERVQLLAGGQGAHVERIVLAEGQQEYLTADIRTYNVH